MCRRHRRHRERHFRLHGARYLHHLHQQLIVPIGTLKVIINFTSVESILTIIPTYLVVTLAAQQVVTTVGAGKDIVLGGANSAWFQIVGIVVCASFDKRHSAHCHHTH